MRDTIYPLSWNDPIVIRYEKTIPLKIPGYTHLYEMTDRLIATQLTVDAPKRILVIGAGGGQEIVTLGSRHANWGFTGVDPSAQMLELAKRRTAAADLTERSFFVEGTIEDLPEEQEHNYDAATCLLVLHFLKGLQLKKDLLQEIAKRLKPGAPFCLAAISGDPHTAAFSVQMSAWKRHMQDNGIGIPEWERFAASIGNESDPVSATVVQALLEEAGFREPTRYFGSYLVDAWFAIRE
ncbi:class I SAM-dependent methyltransferase [Brevibacillus sp. NRS-1366]|uniref:class I SAM-dependent methyltransferase n=1 Tax=Brevibacillus sp. NRS-1366 TaxID=3233899 RepID=UPI003D1E8AD9